MDRAKKIYSFLETTGEKIYGSDESKEYNVNCFLCTDKRHRLGINKETEKWSCFNCRSGGKKLKTLEWAFKNRKKVKNNDTIEKTEQEVKCRIPPNFHKPFFKEIFNTKDNDCARYLIKERGFSQEAIKHFELGFRWEFQSRRNGGYDAGDHLVIPYIKEGKCVNVKYRKLEPDKEKKDKWRREEGGVSSLFNDAVIDNFDYNELIVSESELDSIAIWEMGFKNVVGLTTGAGGFKNKPEWADRLERFEKIYLVLDSDKAGQEGAKELATMLGLGRCYNIILPEGVKDPNDFLLNDKYTPDDFTDLLAHGTKFGVRNTRSLRSYHKQFYHEKFISKERTKSSKYDTPWKPVNRIIGPINDGNLFVLGGKIKTGKTTCAMELMKHWAKKGHNAGIYSCEMRGERLHDKWLLSEPHRFSSKNGIDHFDKLAYHRACLRLPSNRLHIFNPTVQEDIRIDGVIENAEAMVKRYNLGILVVDNLHYLCRGGDENAMVSEATQKLKLLAERLNILVVLIAHPKKTNMDKQLKPEDLKGSSSIMQDADIIWLQHRPLQKDDMEEEEIKTGYTKHDPMTFKVDIFIVGRFTEGGRTFLYFSGAYSTFKCDGIGYEKILSEIRTKGKKKKRKRQGL